MSFMFDVATNPRSEMDDWLQAEDEIVRAQEERLNES